jgi:hypothetical protein
MMEDDHQELLREEEDQWKKPRGSRRPHHLRTRRPHHPGSRRPHRGTRKPRELLLDETEVREDQAKKPRPTKAHKPHGKHTKKPKTHKPRHPTRGHHHKTRKPATPAPVGK